MQGHAACHLQYAQGNERDAPPQRRGPFHGIGKVLKAAGEVGLGIGEGVIDTGRTAVTVVTHPRRTARGVSRLVTNPVDTLDALGSQPQHTGRPGRSGARKAGHAIGKFGVDVISMGGSAVARTADTVTDANQTARRVDRVARAGRDGQPSAEPVRLGGVARGAAGYVTEPIRDTLRAVGQPDRTVDGLNQAAKHPRQAAEKFDNRESTLPTRSERVGRGAARLVDMAGLLPGPIDSVRDVSRAGQTVGRVADAGNATVPKP